MKYEEKINKAILTLDVLIDCTKEDGTSYNARKEWEALATFKQLQTNWNELKKWLEEQYKDLEYANEYCIERDGCDNDYDINKMEAYEEMLNKMQELEGKSE